MSRSEAGELEANEFITGSLPTRLGLTVSISLELHILIGSDTAPEAAGLQCRAQLWARSRFIIPYLSSEFMTEVALNKK